MGKIIKSYGFATPGEERAAKYFEKNLPASWAIICNKMIKNPYGNEREIDFIIIGEHTIFVIDEKSWTGKIHGDENGWVLPGGSSCNPLSDIERVSRLLKGNLESKIPMLKNLTKDYHLVFSRLFFSSETPPVLNVADSRKKEKVLFLNQNADDELVKFDDNRSNINLSEYVKYIEKALIGLSHRPAIPKRINDFNTVETIISCDEYLCLRAIHEDGQERILKLIKKPMTADEKHSADLEHYYKREYETLKQLHGIGRAPEVDPYFSWNDDQYWVIPIHPIEGQTLQSDRISVCSNGQRVFSIFKDAFVALSEVHKLNILHRALNPDRIWIDNSDKIVFSDFMNARIPDTGTIAELSDESVTVFSAPECINNIFSSDSGSDLYSLVASMYFWITGITYKSHDQIKLSEISALSELDKQEKDNFEYVLYGCLQQDVADRLSVQDVLKSFFPDSVSDKQELAVGDIIYNQDEIIMELGRGSTSVTYLAHDLLREEDYVLKKITNPSLAESVTRNEYRTLKDMSHPGLPKIIDIKPPSEPYQLKMEYVKGQSLKTIMKDHQSDPDYLLDFASKMLNILSHIHKFGLIHRDISPSNILIPENDDAYPKLIDFGFATQADSNKFNVGTLKYRAPEIDRGESWTHKCDIYAIGVILFELLTGHLPYQSNDRSLMKKKQIPCDSKFLKEFDADLISTLFKAASFDPDKRILDADDFLSELRKAKFPHRTPIDWQMELGKEQLRAVSDYEGPMLVLAGVGTGKTRVLTYRAAYLIQNKHARPEEVLAITFTNKAAKEMATRIKILLGDSVDYPVIGTFHKVCADLLRKYGHSSGFLSKFSILDDIDQFDLIKHLLLKIVSSSTEPVDQVDIDSLTNKCILLIEKYKTYLKEPSDSDSEIETGFADDVIIYTHSIYDSYKTELKNRRMYDFSDLIFNTYIMIQRNERVKYEILSTYRFILVDEFQDINYAQYEFVKLLINPNTKNILIVGDDDQSIYHFRYADSSYFKSFIIDYNLNTNNIIKLTDNFRSAGTILQLSNSLLIRESIDHEPPEFDGESDVKGGLGNYLTRVIKDVSQVAQNSWKILKDPRLIAEYIFKIPKLINPMKERGNLPKIVELADDNDEARYVAKEIKDYISRGGKYSEIAVLYRIRRHQELVKELLSINEIPYVVYENKMSKNRIAKRMLAFFDLYTDPDNSSLVNTTLDYPVPQLENESKNKFLRYLREQNINVYVLANQMTNLDNALPDDLSKEFKLHDYLKMIHHFKNNLDQQNIQGSIDILINAIPENINKKQSDKLDIIELGDYIVNEYGTNENISRLIDTIKLETTVTTDDNQNAVVLMTIHAAKGKEFNKVIIIGVEEGSIPSFFSKKPDEIREELRLLYVAVTRAIAELTITYSKKRNGYERERSRFVGLIPEKYYDNVVIKKGKVWD